MVHVMVEKNILHLSFFFLDIGVTAFMIYFLIRVLLKTLNEFIDIH